MSQAMQDPLNPGQWLLQQGTEGSFGAQVGPTVIGDVHPESACAGEGCPIHHPSDHPLKDAPLNWRSDRGLMERICEHGIGHPDADAVAFHRKIGRLGTARHGCDGCCTRA